MISLSNLICYAAKTKEIGKEIIKSTLRNKMASFAFILKLVLLTEEEKETTKTRGVEKL